MSVIEGTVLSPEEYRQLSPPPVLTREAYAAWVRANWRTMTREQLGAVGATLRQLP